MPRVKPTKKIDVIGNFDLRPENAVGDYIESKKLGATFIKEPNTDSAGDSIELLYVANVREHNAMVELQKNMVDAAKRQSKVNSNRIFKMYKTQERLRHRFIDVNNFIKDCVDKKRTAENVIKNEIALHAELVSNIREFKNSIAELSAFREDIKATLEELKPYEKVLDDVVKVSDIFVSPKDCMDRCDALMLAQLEITNLDNQKLYEIEQMRRRMIQLTNEASLTILGLKNNLTELERSYNHSRTLCSKWEKILSNCKHALAEQFLHKYRAKYAIRHMYHLLCKRRGSDEYSKRSIEDQLDVIKEEVELMQEILREHDKTNVVTGEGKYCDK